MNRIDKALIQNNKILSIYFTAGYPNINDTANIIVNLEQAGVNMIEIGLPFSDPLADGPVIQNSGTISLQNGMTTVLLFKQLQNIRQKVQIPLIIMGYINPIIQFGVEEFCKKCNEIGIDGVIIPDLPIDIYVDEFKSTFEKYNLYNILLITPQTSEERIKYIDSQSKGFIYMVSSNAITGNKNEIENKTEAYFERVANYKLNNPQIVGFGIYDKKSLEKPTKYQKGAIIGSDFIRHITENGINSIKKYIENLF